MQKRLIEWNLPLAEISEESAREKNIRHGHPSTLHIWWARRPLAASRATTFAALIDDPGEENPEEREYLIDLIRRISPWEAVKEGNSKEIEDARKIIKKQYGHPPRILDPFAGGGSIPLEALRLGCETYASDYNPVAVFIEKATLEWPQKFGRSISLPSNSSKSEKETKQLVFGKNNLSEINLLAHLVNKWSTIILDEATDEIRILYPNDEDGWIPVGYLWSRTIQCINPECQGEIPLIKQFWLVKGKNKSIAYRPIIDKNKKEISFELLDSAKIIKEANFDPNNGTVSKGDAKCLFCEQITSVEKVREKANRGEISERLVAIILHSPHQSGKRYRIATNKDYHLFEMATELLNKILVGWPYIDTALPDEELPPIGTLGFRIQRYGFSEWKDLFNTRQKVAILTFLKLIKQKRNDVKEYIDSISSHLGNPSPDYKEELTNATLSYLAIILDRLIDKNANLVVWNNVGEKIEHVFGRQAISMIWDYVELNVFSGVNGDWKSQRDWVIRYVSANALCDKGVVGFVSKESAMDLPFPDNHFDAILTDPPYYDNVPYADLSDFFYIWLKRAIGEYFPSLFSTPLTPKKSEAIMEPVRHKNSKQAAKSFFENAISQAFTEFYRILQPGGIAVVVYAHKTTEGWESLLNA